MIYIFLIDIIFTCTQMLILNFTVAINIKKKDLTTFSSRIKFLKLFVIKYPRNIAPFYKFTTNGFRRPRCSSVCRNLTLISSLVLRFIIMVCHPQPKFLRAILEGKGKRRSLIVYSSNWDLYMVYRFTDNSGIAIVL